MRCVSFFLTGSQAFYKKVREDVTTYIGNHRDIFDNLSMSENYLEESQMEVDGKWGTVIEFFAIATMLATPVCVFCQYNLSSFKWLTYGPLDQIPKNMN